jgi:hypothetical protein
MIRIADALQSLRPNSQFAVRGNDVIEWLDTEQTQPSKSEIDAEVIRLQAEYDAKEYARKRALEYPSVQDFMEAYTEKEIGGDSTKWDAYKTAYNKVRTDNPKE